MATTNSTIHKDWKYFIAALWNFLTSKTGAFIIGVSAIAIGWYQFYINRPILKYDVETVNFISSENNNQYTVNVRGKEYKDLYMTRIFLQNKGASALSGQDVSKIGHDPIRIVVPEGAKMVHYVLDNTTTTPAITASLKPVGKDLVIEFDYLNSDYQIGASILHENPHAKFKIEGSALNVNEITREWSERQLKFWGLWSLGILYFILLVLYVHARWKKRHQHLSSK